MSLYEPLNMLPKNETRDMTLSQVFSASVQGSQITDYQLKIYNNDTNGLLYDSTKLPLSPDLYNGETLNHTVPITGGIATIRNLKWTLQVWNNSETVTSRENFFENYSTPTATITVPATITTQSYEFTCVYTQSQSLSVESYIFYLYDEDGVLIEETEVYYSGSLKHTFDGFVDGNTYGVKCAVTNVKNVVVESDIEYFEVDYVQPSINIIPIVENLEDLGTIKLSWAGVYDNVGVDTGTISYIDDYIDIGNKALQVNNSSNVVWSDLKINNEFTNSFEWSPLSINFIGDIVKLEDTNTNNFYTVGYDGDKFYANINGIYVYTEPYILSVDKTYLLSCFPTHITLIL